MYRVHARWTQRAAYGLSEFGNAPAQRAALLHHSMISALMSHLY
jgi:hypothetical protein